MKVNELKKLLEKCDEKKAKEIISLIYKKLPKSAKEELDNEIIALINNIKIEKVKKEEKSFETLSNEINEFIQNAYDRNYFIPNKVIPKKQRSLWRYKFMGYVKSLKNINEEDKNYEESNILLLRLFDVLSYACGYYIFLTHDPFVSIGMQQSDFYELLTNRFLKNNRDKETLIVLIKLATTNLLDRNPLHEDMMNILIESMENKEQLMYIKQLTKEIFMNGGFVVEEHDASFYEYYKRESDNNLLLLVYRISLMLKDPFSELDFYMENYKDRDKEIGLYIILDSIYYDDSDKDWIDVYEYVTKKYNIYARDSLRSEYREKKERINK